MPQSAGMTADESLAGSVRVKLERAREAAQPIPPAGS